MTFINTPTIEIDSTRW